MNSSYYSCVPEAAVILSLAAAYCGQKIDDRGKKRKEERGSNERGNMEGDRGGD